MTTTIYISTDGGSRGNPGEAAYGFVVKDSDKKLLIQIGKRLGIKTNNYAEYMAVVSALRWVKENINPSPTEIHFSLDSQLIERQMKGIYKIKEETLRSLYFTVQSLITEIGATVTFTHIMREFNKEADTMVNKALDSE